MKTIFLCADPDGYANYIHAVERLGAKVLATLDDSRAAECDALLLPGGGDVRSTLYGQEDNGSQPPDDERDEREFRVTARFLALERPIFGICRGLQLLNVVFGGTLIQDVPGHSQIAKDLDAVHLSRADDPLLEGLYGKEFPVNSAHHQVADRLGTGLRAIQWSPEGYVEALRHESRPILAVQWHPERICFERARPDAVDGAKVIKAFLDMI